MPDPWFCVGLAMGVAIAGFCAVGSFGRGVDSVPRRTWTREIALRQRAVVASQRRDAVTESSRAPAQAV